MSEGKKGGKVGKIVLIVLGVFVLLMVIGAMAGGETAGESGATGKAEPAADTPPTAATAAEISAAFQENEVKAKLAYGDKRLQVSGTIKDIGLDFADRPAIKLRGANDAHGMGISQDGKMTDVTISGLPNEAAANLSKGEKITVVCDEVAEMMGGAHLSGCALS